MMLIPIFYWILTTLLLIRIPGALSQNDYQTCREPLSWCGQQILYPFWGGQRSIACGSPGFELVCQGGALFFTMDSTTYRVGEIDYNTAIIVVARSDFWNTTCPASVSPTTVDFTRFEFSTAAPDQNITLYYRCNPLYSVLPNRFNCSGNGNANTFNFYSTEPASTTVDCDWNVSVPVNQTAFAALAASPSPDLLREALGSGFSLRWTANNENCYNCTQSGGTCGFNQTSDTFTCFSPPVTGNNGRRNAMPIGLFVAGGVLAGVGLGWIIFYCLQRRKRRIAAQAMAAITKEPTPSHSANHYTTHSSCSFTKTASSNGSFEFGQGSTYFGLQVFTYSELEHATDGFHASKELGNGGFGIVYYGVLSDSRPVAIKRLYENNYRRLEQFMNELEILSRLKHENLVKLYGCTSRRSRELLLVYEFLPNGTVADHLQSKRANSSSMTWPIRLNIAIETADALAYLHRSDIIHRDVKTNNILLDNEFHVKVADFGLSRLFPTDVTHVSTAPQGTPGYVDPEYYQCYHLTEKSDVYSFVVILIELMSSLPAVDTNRNRSDINLANMAVTKIQNHSLLDLVDPNIEFETNPQVRRTVTLVGGLAFRCLQQDSNLRPTMGEVLEELKGIKKGFSVGQVEIIDTFSDEFEDEILLRGRHSDSDHLPYSV